MESGRSYDIDRGSAACDLLGDVLARCGLDGYGRPDEETMKRRERANAAFDWFRPTDRGVDLHHPTSGVLLMRTRSYWWDGDDGREANLPNLEVPALGLEVRWYKYAFRDATANRPVTFAVAQQVEKLLEPVLASMRPYAPQPVRYPLDWTRDGEDDADSTRWECRLRDPDAGDPMYSHGTVALTEDARDPYSAEMLSRDDMFVYHGMFPTLEDAKAWCARQCVAFLRHARFASTSHK